MPQIIPPEAPGDALALDRYGISQKAFDLIVESEVSSRAVYEARYRRPTLPGGQSGVTIGIGYDCGHTRAATIRSEWTGRIPATMVTALAGIAGLKGEAARKNLAVLRQLVDVPWEAALGVFADASLPKYVLLARSALPNFDELPPDCQGALVSLVYNRGASFAVAGPRYAEMRTIKALMAAQDFGAIAAQLQAMKRLWSAPSVRGVALRREREAALFTAGLAAKREAAMCSRVT